MIAIISRQKLLLIFHVFTSLKIFIAEKEKLIDVFDKAVDNMREQRPPQPHLIQQVIDHATSALRFDTKNEALYSTRAACSARLHNFKAALRDFLVIDEFQPSDANNRKIAIVSALEKGIISCNIT